MITRHKRALRNVGNVTGAGCLFNRMYLSPRHSRHTPTPPHNLLRDNPD
jgi:hypothetical protein